jgi:hypothetical protein
MLWAAIDAQILPIGKSHVKVVDGCKTRELCQVSDSPTLKLAAIEARLAALEEAVTGLTRVLQSSIAARDQIREEPSEWMTTEQIAGYLGYAGVARVRSVYRFLHFYGVPTSRRGARTLLVRRSDVEQALDRRAKLRKRGVAHR